MPPICSKPRAGSSDLISNEAPTMRVRGSAADAVCAAACGALMSKSDAATAADRANDHKRMRIRTSARVRSQCQEVGRAVKCVDRFPRTEHFPLLQSNRNIPVDQQTIVEAPEVELLALLKA